MVSYALIAGAQGIAGGPVYQGLLMNNPGMSGVEGNGIMRLSYLNHYPGNHLDLNSLYLSYDTYIPALHGGGSFYLSDDYLGGIVNDIRGGFSYAYFLQAGRKLFVNAGLTASVFHRGFNFGNAVFPDQIDPLGGPSIPTAEVTDNKGRTVFDVGAGLVVSSGKYSGGISVNHLAEPELYTSTVSTERIRRRYTAHASAHFDLPGNGGFNMEPLLLASLQDNYFFAGAGTSAGNDRFALNILLTDDNSGNINLQAGFSFSFSIVSVYYNYRFNLASGNSLLPVSLMQQAGLTFSLYNVEKRKDINTINFPKM